MAEGETLAEAFVRVGIDDNRFLAGMGRLRGRIDSFAERMDNVAASVRKAMLVSAAAVAGLTQRFASLEQSMAEVQAVMGTGLSPKGFQQLTDAAKEMGATTAFTSKQAADALILLSRAGFTANEQLDLLPNTLNLAAAGGLDIASSADIVAKAMKGLGLQSQEAANLVDVLAKASSTANTDISQLGAGLAKIGRIGIEQGRSMNEMVASLQVLADAGFQGSEGGNALRRILSRLIAPSNQAREAMNKMKFSAANQDGTLKTLSQTIDDLNASMADMTPEQKQVTLSLIAGQQAVAQLSTLMSAGGDALREYESRLGAVDGTAQTMRETMENTLVGQFRLMLSAIDAVATALGEQLAPTMRRLMTHLTNAANAAGQWLQENEKVVASLIQLGTQAAIAGAALVALNATAKTLSVTLAIVSGGAGLVVRGFRKLTAAAVAIKTAASSAMAVKELGGAMQLAASAAKAVSVALKGIGWGVAAAGVMKLWSAYNDLSNTMSRIQQQTDAMVDASNSRTDAVKNEIAAIQARLDADKSSAVSNKQRLKDSADELKQLKARAKMLTLQATAQEVDARRLEKERNSRGSIQRLSEGIGNVISFSNVRQKQIDDTRKTAEAMAEEARQVEELIALKERQHNSIRKVVVASRDEEKAANAAARQAAQAAQAAAAHRVRSMQQIEMQIGAIGKQIKHLEKQEQSPLQSFGVGTLNRSIQNQLTVDKKDEVDLLKDIERDLKRQLDELKEQTEAIKAIDTDARFGGGGGSGIEPG